MDGPSEQHERRTLSPAVLGSALFVAATAVFAVTFVAGRGGLQMPVAATQPPVALASEGPTGTEPTEPPPTASAAPIATPPAPSPTVAPTMAPTPVPTIAPPSLDPDDPLARLPECPGHPGCFQYVVQRGDTLTGIVSRYLLSITTVFALNPDLSDPSLIVVGETLFLGRDPMARLDPCPNIEPCSLYVVESGDSLPKIAARYGLTVDGILEINPTISRPIQPGTVIRLPHPSGETT